MIKKILFIIIQLPLWAYGSAHYFSNSGDDSSDGLTTATSQKSLQKFNNSFMFYKPGDSILFKCGDTFYGSMLINKSGTLGKPIYLGSYGNGKPPVITGLTTINKWDAYNNKGIYKASAPLASAALNNVIINDSQQVMGRFPNKNYLVYNEIGGSSTSGGVGTITSASTVETDWTGATLVAKFKNWVINKVPIKSQINNTFSYIQPQSSPYPGIKGFGFFIQNDIRTLDQFGEWYYNPDSKNLYIFFGQKKPENYTITISTIDTLCLVNNQNFITFNNIYFEGSNKEALYCNLGSNIIIKNCIFNSNGKTAISGWFSTNIEVDNCTIKNSLGSGIFFRNTKAKTPGFTVKNCTILNTEPYAGLGIAGDESNRSAIGVFGNAINTETNIFIQNNTIIGVGYLGIEWQGSGVMIEKNFINYTNLIKDDGGGVYTFNSIGKKPTIFKNRVIQNNIILNAVGCADGTSGTNGKGRGIYCDENTNNVLIKNNSIAYCSNAGLYCNTPYNITFDGNIVFKCGVSWQINRYEIQDTVKNIRFVRNQFYPFVASYSDNAIDSPYLRTIEQSLSSAIQSDSNSYFIERPMPFAVNMLKANGKGYATVPKNLLYLNTLGLELSNLNKFKSTDELFFFYNNKPSSISQILTGKFKDAVGNIYTNTVNIPPFSAIVLASLP